MQCTIVYIGTILRFRQAVHVQEQLILYPELRTTTMSARPVSTIAIELTGSMPTSLDANLVAIQFLGYRKLRFFQGRKISTELDYLGSKGQDMLEYRYIADQVSKPCGLMINVVLFERAVFARRMRTGPAM